MKKKCTGIEYENCQEETKKIFDEIGDTSDAETMKHIHKFTQKVKQDLIDVGMEFKSSNLTEATKEIVQIGESVCACAGVRLVYPNSIGVARAVMLGESFWPPHLRCDYGGTSPTCTFSKRFGFKPTTCPCKVHPCVVHPCHSCGCKICSEKRNARDRVANENKEELEKLQLDFKELFGQDKKVERNNTEKKEEVEEEEEEEDWYEEENEDILSNVEEEPDLLKNKTPVVCQETFKVTKNETHEQKVETMKKVAAVTKGLKQCLINGGVEFKEDKKGCLPDTPYVLCELGNIVYIY